MHIRIIAFDYSLPMDLLKSRGMEEVMISEKNVFLCQRLIDKDVLRHAYGKSMIYRVKTLINKFVLLCKKIKSGPYKRILKNRIS